MLEQLRKINKKGRISVRTVVLVALVLGLPAGAWAGFSAQGFSAQGFSAQGFSAQGFSAQGFSAQGFSAQGFSAQGFSAQGFSAQGFSAQGFSAQGFSAQGVALLGTDLVSSDLKGVDIGSVDVRGTTSDSGPVSIELTSSDTMSTGSGTYISIGGSTAVGHFATAHLVDASGNPAEDLDLFIAGVMPDPMPNEQHRADNQPNNDIWLYEVFFYLPSSGQWASLCPFHDVTGATTAMAIPEDQANPNKFIFACTATGVAAKCARIWGYRPWHHNDTTWVFDDDPMVNDWVEKQFDMKPFYDTCKTAARAGYCQDRQSFTRNGTLVDLFDTRQFVWPNAIENPLSALNPNSQWMFAQEYFVTQTPLVSDPSVKVTALQRTRWRDLSPVGQCPDHFADVSRLEEDHFEDARFANPLVADPRIEIFSPNYCQHSENEQGPALAWDCSPCTTAICRHHPHCCSADPTLPQPVWDASCVADQNFYCQDVEGGGGPWWPLGKVWPRDYPASTAPRKYLIGPGGAVEATVGVSTSGTQATVEGWACDPEWPGTAVSVQIYGGGTREHGGTLLGTVYADEALASPLALEVGTACDGLGHASARHGFSFTLPTSTSGNVFVYALDTATADGHAAPPTLLRNGIVHVPTCDHSEHLTGTALDSSCSTCAASVCAQGGLGGCCTTAWTDACADAAESCEPSDTSAATDGRLFGETLTGWIEAPATGTYVFAATAQPSRVTVNGTKLVDWLEAAGPTSGSIDLQQGGRYHIRWDRFQASPPVTPTDPGLTWQPPGALSQQAVPSGSLYRVVPGVGTGLLATYFDNPGLTGPSGARVDAEVEQSSTTVLPPGVLLPTYSVQWEGEIVPLYSDTYTFTLVSAGAAHLEVGGTTIVAPPAVAPPLTGCTPHDVCALGDKLAATTITTPACDPCVDAICAKDPFCCDGGYLSYYSTEPVWDAKCITEVGTVCGLTCKNPIPAATTQPNESTPIALQAGVRTHIRVTVDVTTSDYNVQLIWESARQPRGTVPSSVLYPPGPSSGAGAGLNVVSFATKNGGTQIDFATPLASGAAPDLTLAPPVGPSGLPLVDVLASPSDGLAGTPPPPVLESPRPGSEIFNGALAIPVSGKGGVLGGSVVVDIAGVDTVLPVGLDGTYGGDVPVPGYGPYTLHLTQRSYATPTCTSPPAAFCAVSTSVDWAVTVSPLAPVSPPAPTITSPRDPTSSPNPADDTFVVTGTATPGAVNVCDEGTGTAITTSVTAAGNGKINDSVQLSAGSTATPAKGWHKLVFTSASSCGPPVVGGSRPVFVSVGIRPPTVTFPRTGAEIDCSPNAPPNPGLFDVKGSIPYPEASFGRLRIAEETGRAPLQFLQRDITIDTQNPNADGSFNFHTSLNLPPGKHLIYFFQAPDPDPTLTPDEVADHFRAYANVADTPKSRIELHVPPPQLQFPGRGQVIVQQGPLTFGEGNCNPNATAQPPDCALPEADVNIRVGKRVWTARADQNGNWSQTLDLPAGWHKMVISQVVDSRTGGGWQEGCPGDETLAGITRGDAPPTLQLPGFTRVPADGPNGTKIDYPATAMTVTGKPATIDCAPPSGTVFPIGKTLVLCTAIDPDTQAVGLGGFTVEVDDGPPVVSVPSDMTAEAQSALGAIVSWTASATDLVSGPLPVDCVPSSPALFSLDETTPVTCQATDGAGNTTSASFNVTVHDTTPPTLCPLPDIQVLAAGPGGGPVSFKTCADDLVDGHIEPIDCDHASGSFFPVGKTVVTCSATDKHGNSSPRATFTVAVGDSTPPVLNLPGTITVAATSRRGTRVSYSVTATDDVDPSPLVSCTPPSGGMFPLGNTTVNCTATDASGNVATGSFLVRVLVSFGGFLPPIANNGSSVFYRPVPVQVRFALAGGSANVFDLLAKLFVAHVDAAGNIGPEQPAVGLPPGIGNNFVFVGLPLLLVREYDLTMDDHAMAGGVWQLRADLGDGIPHTVRITLR